MKFVLMAVAVVSALGAIAEGKKVYVTLFAISVLAYIAVLVLGGTPI